ncbi:hypothetical protein [Microcystis aeruginosa]|nr:hypothetical protein [Microcystis aeruginosa]
MSFAFGDVSPLVISLSVLGLQLPDINTSPTAPLIDFGERTMPID